MSPEINGHTARGSRCPDVHKLHISDRRENRVTNFHHLAYWQDKALSLAIETRLFINGEYTAAAENETFETVDPGQIRAPLAKIARGKSAVDIDRAVSAARGVFGTRRLVTSSPAKRKAVLE